jgi:predicted nucleic acid-binding protein
MDRIFIDSDVLLDVFAKRNPFYEYSAKLLTHVEKKMISGYTSPLVFANIHHILRKLKSKAYALQTLRKLRMLVGVLSVDERHIDQALSSAFTDFEDAIQYHSAKSSQMDFIITRNKKDYKHSDITVCTPEEYLAILESKLSVDES